jgi:Tol biopolymer transport system component
MIQKMPLPAGAKIGHYEVTAPLGKGGMGEVYRAHDTKLGRDVAIKVLPSRLAHDPERLARFEREAKVLASLNHPHIAQIYGIEESSAGRALVMELVPGKTLSGPLPLAEALNIARQIAEALQAAHNKNIVHRDLKPANIMLTPDGTVKVLDFGLAKLAERAAPEGGDPSQSPTLTLGATEAGMIMGTAAYMAPEQARGQEVDRRADIWAFGVVLYEMLTGKPLFHGETISDILAAVLKVEPDLSVIPTQLRPLLERCLQKEPKKRLQAVGDWELLLADTPAASAPLPSRLGRIAWAAAGVAVFALAALSLVHFRETPASAPVMNFSADLGLDAITSAGGTVAISPDGTRIVFLTRGAGGRQMLATRLLNQPKATPMSGTEAGTAPFFSPDGQWVGFVADGKLKKVAVQGGAPISFPDVSAARGASWGDDGNIVVMGQATLLYRVPSAGGTPQPLSKLAPGEATHRWPQVLPGSQAVLFTASSSNNDFEEANIEVLSLKTGQVKILQRGGYFGRYLPGPRSQGYLVYLHQGTMFGAPFDPARLELQGSPVPLLEDVAGDPQTGNGQFDFASTGSLVYLSGKAADEAFPIVWLDRAGKTAPLVAKPGAYDAPRFSPDGKRLAFAARGGKGSDVWVSDIARDTLAQITFTAPGDNELAWAPDGKHIVYRSLNPSVAWWVRADGAGEPQRLLEGQEYTRPQSFSPDGRRLLLAGNTTVSLPDLWILPLDLNDPEHPKPGKPEAFLKTPVVEVDGAFSPDGRWVAYASNESGVEEVFVRPAPGLGSGGKWKISTGGGKFPAWSRAGRELFFLGGDDRIMAADYTAAGDSFSADKPRVWSDKQILRRGTRQNFDMAPDGQRAAVFPRPEAQESKGSLHATFLLNFTQEIRRRLDVAGK